MLTSGTASSRALVDGGLPDAAEGEALIESSFRRLLAAVEADRTRIRSSWQEVEDENETMKEEMDRLRRDTEEWTSREQSKVVEKQTQLDQLRYQMTVLDAPGAEYLEINCSGRLLTMPKASLVSIEGSLLNHMFSRAFVDSIPKDQDGRFFLDFNPVCFGFITDYLSRWKPDRPPPSLPKVPPEQQMNMDILVETLRLKPFLVPNKVNPTHNTSLRVNENKIFTTLDGCQVISAMYPVPMSSPSYFEVRVLRNSSARGGLAVGVCGHIPTGKEVSNVRLKGSIMYSSTNGLIGGNVSTYNVQKDIELNEGSIFGVRYDVSSHTLTWYYNRNSIGSCVISDEAIDQFHVIYPVFALFDEGQAIEVDFSLSGPHASLRTVGVTAITPAPPSPK